MSDQERDDAAEVRDIKADERDVKADRRDVKADGRDVKASERDVKTDKREVEVDREVASTDVAREDLHLLMAAVLRLFRRVLLPALVILIALTLASIIRSYSVDESVGHVQDSADALSEQTSEARQAAIDARDELRAAVDALRESQAQGEPLDNSAINRALEAITRIETFLCNGPCETFPNQ